MPDIAIAQPSPLALLGWLLLVSAVSVSFAAWLISRAAKGCECPRLLRQDGSGPGRVVVFHNQHCRHHESHPPRGAA